MGRVWRAFHFFQNPLKLRRSAAVFCWKQKFCRHRGEHLSRPLFSLLHFDLSGWKQLLNVCEGTVYLAHLFPFPIVGFNCLPKKQNHFKPGLKKKTLQICTFNWRFPFPLTVFNVFNVFCNLTSRSLIFVEI